MIHKDCRYFEGIGNFCSRVTAMRCDEFPECEFKYIYFLQKDIKMLKDTLQEIKVIANNIVYSDEIPAYVNDKECPLNGGDGFDNHCNMRCPFILGKQILDLITKVEEE